MNTHLQSNNSSSKSVMLHSMAKYSVQPKLTVNSPGDTYEQEADAMADRVMRMSSNEASIPVTGLIGKSLQRKCAHCEEEEKRNKPIMRKAEAGNAGLTVSSSFASSLNASKGGGSPLPQGTRSFMENAFSADFSSVRIHNDRVAAELSRGINAKAFTAGNNIYFKEGHYNPESSEGRNLLSHELTHTLQQSATSSNLQRSCSDGACETCDGGVKNLIFTAFFRIRATAANMARIRAIINEAKTDFSRCCIRASFFFNWRLLRGGGTFDPGVARPAGSADGSWDYDDEAESLGEGNTFNGVKGVPIVFVDDIPRTGGGVTIDSRYDAQYTGRTYMAISVNQAHAIANTFAHEFGHVAGLEHDTTLPDANIMNTGTNIDERFCNAVRSSAT